MNKEFIPFKEAKRLKKLGFNEPCFGYYENQSKLLIINYTNPVHIPEEHKSRPAMFRVDNRNSVLSQWMITAPLYQQAFEWFRDKYRLEQMITFNHVTQEYAVMIMYRSSTKAYGWISPIRNYEDARLECLKEMIKIVKNENNF